MSSTQDQHSPAASEQGHIEIAPGLGSDARPNKDIIWINAGELSGDMHGARLLQALRGKDPSLVFTGMGGPYMRAEQDFTSRFQIEELSVMGVGEVIRHLPRIIGLLRRIKAAITETKPKSLVLIDAPSFHFRVIKAILPLGIPVYYYISPKAWAWKEKRALFIKKHVRRLISILPFEVDFYRRHGMEIDYVGNPLVDMVDFERLRTISFQSGKIGLLPGSRAREVRALLPEFGKAARILLQQRPDLIFHVVCAPGFTEETLRQLWPNDVPVCFQPAEDRYAFMRSCEMLIAASGTVTMEAALVGTPTLVTYKVSLLTALVARLLLTIPYVSLPNLILNKPLFPELLQKDCNGPALAHAALQWLCPQAGQDPLPRIRAELDGLRALMGAPGAPGRAADVILNDLQTMRDLS